MDLKVGDIVKHCQGWDGKVVDIEGSFAEVEFGEYVNVICNISELKKKDGADWESILDSVFSAPGRFKGAQIDLPASDLYCNCGSDDIVVTSTSVASKPGEHNTFIYCRACKKERI